MSKPLSLDLRTPVLAAISGGLSGREAAVCFRMTASSAIRWRALERRQRNAKAKPVGGDRRSVGYCQMLRLRPSTILKTAGPSALKPRRNYCLDQSLMGVAATAIQLIFRSLYSLPAYRVEPRESDRGGTRRKAPAKVKGGSVEAVLE
jgi:hypothetical protein